MLKALIISIATLGIWLAAGAARTPAAPLAAGVASTAATALEPGPRDPVVQL